MFVRRLALAIAVLFGLVGAQGPEFAQQYRQRIGGALDELKAIIATFDAEASHEGLAPAAAIARLEHNPDPLARERGRAIDEANVRAGRLERQLQAMSEAGPIRRLTVFVTNFDPAARRAHAAEFRTRGAPDLRSAGGRRPRRRVGLGRDPHLLLAVPPPPERRARRAAA